MITKSLDFDATACVAHVSADIGSYTFEPPMPDASSPTEAEAGLRGRRSDELKPLVQTRRRTTLALYHNVHAWSAFGHDPWGAIHRLVGSERFAAVV